MNWGATSIDWINFIDQYRMTDVRDVAVVRSDDEVECFLDNEVFFGPVTEREKEVRVCINFI